MKTLRVAAYFNNETGNWVARQKQVTPHRSGGGYNRNNVYGYGVTLMEALDDLLTQTTHGLQKLICRVALPGHRMQKVNIPN